jgi:hypothetical protein
VHQDEHDNPRGKGGSRVASSSDAIELLRQHLMSGRSRAAPLTLMPANMVPLASHEALVGLGDDAFSLWTLTANLQAPCLVAVTQRRAVYFDHLVALGLFSITGGPRDFYARLVSRADAKPEAQAAGEPSLSLLFDSAHHVCRAVSEQLGHRLTEAERAIVFERIWRHAFAPPPAPGFLRDERTYSALERLCRSGKVELLWGDARTFIVGDQVSQALRARESALGALAIFEAEAEFSRQAARAPWERVSWSDTARVFLESLREQRECDRDTLFSQLPAYPPDEQAPPMFDPQLVERMLGSVLADEPLFFELLDEALVSPYPPLLDTLFRHLGDVRPQVPDHPLGPIFDLCDVAVLHDDDPAWRALCNVVSEAPPPLRWHAVNALSQRLGLFD